VISCPRRRKQNQCVVLMVFPKITRRAGLSDCAASQAILSE
jgi:hypothetical protein